MKKSLRCEKLVEAMVDLSQLLMKNFLIFRSVKRLPDYRHLICQKQETGI